MELGQRFNLENNREVVSSTFNLNKVPGSSLQKIGYRFGKKAYFLRKDYVATKAQRYIKEAHPKIYEAQIKAREHGGLEGDYQWCRLFELFSLLEHFKPKSVVEYGSGTSSYVFASFLKDPLAFETYDASQYWLDRTLSNKDFSPFITGKQAKVRVEGRDSECVSFFDIPHTRHFDFAYVDGPLNHVSCLDKDDPLVEKFASFPILDKAGHIPNIDVELMWENNIFPKIVVIDGRRPTLRRLLDKNRGRYDVYLKSDYLVGANISPFPKFCYHTVFVLKEPKKLS